jgi:hypothetical protein
MVKLARQKIDLRKHIIVGLVAMLIFSLGLTLGIILDYERYNWVKNEKSIQDVRFQSLQLQYLYLTTLESSSNSTCSVLLASLEDSIADLGYTLDLVTRYEKDSSINSDEFALVKRNYIIDNIKYWLFAERVKDKCQKDMVTVLYFFSESKCDICPDQGVVLTYYKKIFQDRLLVFPIDTDLGKDEPLIRMLSRQYNITAYPTVVVDSVKYEGVVPKEEAGRIICNSFETNQPECLDILRIQ